MALQAVDAVVGTVSGFDSIFDIDPYVHTEVVPDDYDSKAPHILVLGEWYEVECMEDDTGARYMERERDTEVVHPKCCQYHIVYDFDNDGDFRSYRVHRCMVQDMIDYSGLDLEGIDERPAGEHVFKAWSEYYPGEYGGDYGAEWDGGLLWVD